MTSPRRDWREERRQKILGAAADLFGAQPYDSVQMRDVAARAEVGKPTLYRYFPSKEELFLEVFKSGLDRLEAEIGAILAAKEPPRRKGIVSMFISLKDQRLYVRQNMEPLFDAPVSIARPGEPIGTHVYTAMGPKAGGGGLRWTVVSIPSGYQPVKTADNRKPRNEKPAKAVEYIHAPLQDPRAALDRITMPQDAVDRIADLITPGASLIVSDNKLSGETGTTTDFIVETK